FIQHDITAAAYPIPKIHYFLQTPTVSPSPLAYGNRHTLPKPIAKPTTDKMKSNLLDHEPRSGPAIQWIRFECCARRVLRHMLNE
ncbi:hypothetical protein Bhyg_05923, partial [Pseudolycoriella hygida]